MVYAISTVLRSFSLQVVGKSFSKYVISKQDISLHEWNFRVKETVCLR
jgi:hypothetical protein